MSSPPRGVEVGGKGGEVVAVNGGEREGGRVWDVEGREVGSA